MAEKITYILGAGASIGAFPLVKGSPSWDDKGLADILIQEGEKLLKATFSKPEAHNEALSIAPKMIDTGKKAKAFGNVDSYAKFLYHKDSWELINLKKALAYFFIRQQVCEPYCSLKKETRYLNFITSLVTDDSTFPNHVKVLNWNYDFLLGLEAMNYSSEDLIVEEGKEPQITAPFIKYYPSIGLPIKETLDKIDNSYSAVYLNGIAGYYAGITNMTDIRGPRKGVFHNVMIDILHGDINAKITEEDLLCLFQKKLSGLAHLITFAWEGETKEEFFWGNRMQSAISLAKNTTILVVIGYSFPFYNRKIDNAVFEAMKPTLRKIYFQDPNNNGDFLLKRYGLDTPADIDNMDEPVDLEHIEATDQFYIPVEV